MFRLMILIGFIFAVPCTASADTSPARLYLSDPNPVSLSLNQPVTGCVLNGIIVHPVAQPAERVIWFSERVCGRHKTPVSYVTDILHTPDNMIHKGEKLHISPAKVTLLPTKPL